MTSTSPHFPTDPAGLPASRAPEIVELGEGDAFGLRIEPVAKRIGDATVRMLAYNGSVPGPVLKVRVRARPIEGEANDALIRMLAKSLGVPKSSISVGRGGQSRSKMIVVQGLDDEELRSRLVDGLSGD